MNLAMKSFSCWRCDYDL